MLTVNIEKKLIKENPKVISPQELLTIKEYERLGDSFCESEVIDRLGLSQAAKQGKHILDKNLALKKELSKYNQERVFHVSQIKKICGRYYLRFLPAYLYNGTVDKELASKISQYEIAYNKYCIKQNTFIMAPAASFRLEKRPKDPLLFHKISDEYFYLVHKWGNDLSVFRMFYPLLSSAILYWLIVALVIPAIIAVIGLLFEHDAIKILFLSLGIAIFLWVTLSNIFKLSEGGQPCGFIKKNEWASRYID